MACHEAGQRRRICLYGLLTEAYNPVRVDRRGMLEFSYSLI